MIKRDVVKHVELTTSEVQKYNQSKWLYQLQKLDVKETDRENFSFAVVGPELGGKNGKKLSQKEVQYLKDNGMTPVAYLSIGEASFYEWFWKEEWGSFSEGAVQVTNEAPSWLGKVPNKDWPEGVKVRYWHDEWWEIIKTQLDFIIASGYEGVYLDIVDAFQYWGNDGTYGEGNEARFETDPLNEDDAADEMIKLIENISIYTKATNSDFLVFPQNGESIVQYDDDQSFLHAIDGIGLEDLWFNEEELSIYTENRLPYIEKFSEAGKIVLSVDYVDDGEGYEGENEDRINYYLRECLAAGFYCYPALSDRELDRVWEIEGIGD